MWSEPALEETQDMTEEYFETRSWHSDISLDCNGTHGEFSSPKCSPGLRKQDSDGQYAVADGLQMNTDGEELMAPLGSECSVSLDSDPVLEKAGFPSLTDTTLSNTLKDSQVFTTSKELGWNSVGEEDSCSAVILADSGCVDAANQSSSEEAGLPSILQANTALKVLMGSDLVVASKDLVDISSSKCLKSLDSSYSERKSDILKINTGEEQLMVPLVDESSVMFSDDSGHRSSFEIVSEEAGLPSISQATSEETHTLTDRSEAAIWLEQTPDFSTDHGTSSTPDLINLDTGCDEVQNGSSLEEAGLPSILQASVSVPDLTDSQLYTIPKEKPELIYRSTSAPEVNSGPDFTVASTHRDDGIFSSINLRNMDSSHSERKNNGLKMSMDGEKLMVPLANDCTVGSSDDLKNAEIVHRLSPEEAGLPSFSQASKSDTDSIQSQPFRGFTHTLTATEQCEAEPLLEISSDLDHLNFSTPNHVIDIRNLDSSQSEGMNKGLEMTVAGEARVEPLEGDSNANILDNSECKEVLNGFFPVEAGFSFISEADMSSDNLADLQLLTVSKEMLSDRSEAEPQLDNTPDLDVPSISSPKHTRVLANMERCPSEEKLDGLEMNMDGEQLTEPLARVCSVIVLDDNAVVGSAIKIFPKESERPSISQPSESDPDLIDSRYSPTSIETPELTCRSEVDPQFGKKSNLVVSKDQMENSPKCSPDLRKLENTESSDGEQINADGVQQKGPLENSAVEVSAVILDDSGDDNAAIWSSLEEAGVPSNLHSNKASKDLTDSEPFTTEDTLTSTEQSDEGLQLDSRCDEVLNGSSLVEAGLSSISQASTTLEETPTLKDRSKAVYHLDNTSNLDDSSTDHGNLPSPKSCPEFRNLDSAYTERKGTDKEDLVIPLANNCSEVDECNVESAIIDHQLSPEEAGLPSQNECLEKNKDGKELTVPLDSNAEILDDWGQVKVLNGPSPGVAGFLSISQASMSNTDLISSQHFTTSKHTLASPNGRETEPYLEKVSDLTAASRNEQLDHISKIGDLTVSEMALVSQIMVNKNMVEHVGLIDEAGVKHSEMKTSTVDAELFVGPLMFRCLFDQSCDRSRLRPRGVTSLQKDHGQFSNPNINKKKNVLERRSSIKYCAEDGSSSLSYANSFMPDIPMNNEQTLDLDNDQTERQSNDLENLQFLNTCSMKEFTAIPQKEQEVIYSDNSGYSDSCVMTSSTGKESQSVNSDCVQGNVEDSYVGQLSGPAEAFFKESTPLDSVNITKFTKQFLQGDLAKFEKVCAKEHEVSISYDDYCIQETSGLKTSLHFDAHHGSDTNSNTKQPPPEAPCSLQSSTVEQNRWNHMHQISHLSNNSANFLEIPEAVMMDYKRNISSPLDLKDASQGTMYEIELEENKEIMADPIPCPITDAQHGLISSSCQSTEFSQTLSINGPKCQKILQEQSLTPHSAAISVTSGLGNESKTTPSCPGPLRFQSYPFTGVDISIVSDLDPIMESEHPQEGSHSLDGEQKDFISSVNEDDCNPLQRDENDVLYSVRSLKGVSDKPEDVDTFTCLINSADWNDDLPNSASPDEDLLATSSEEVDNPSHSLMGSKSNSTGSIQSLLKNKDTKNMSAGKSSVFSRLTRIPSFRRSKREPKVGNKVEPEEAKISPAVGEEVTHAPNYNPTVDHLTKCEDQSSDVFGKALGVTWNGQSKSTSSSKNTKPQNTYSEQVQVKPLLDPQKKSKSSDNFRMKLALAQRSLSSFFEIRTGEKDSHQDSTMLNMDIKSRQPRKKMKMSKEAEMLKRTLSLPGPSGAMSRCHLQSDFVSGLTEDCPGLQGIQSYKEDLKITSHPDTSVSGPEMTPAQRNTISNDLATNSGVFKTVQSYENISETLMHPTVFALANQPAPSWTKSLGSFEGLDTPSRPVTPKPQNWSHRSSFRYPSKRVATSLCSLGEGPSLEEVSDHSQRRIGQRATRLASAQSFDSEFLLEGSNSDNQSQASLVSTNSTNESEVSLGDLYF